jgi:hypothetical protein
MTRLSLQLEQACPNAFTTWEKIAIATACEVIFTNSNALGAFRKAIGESGLVALEGLVEELEENDKTI